MNVKYSNTADLALLIGFSKQPTNVDQALLTNLAFFPLAVVAPGQLGILSIGYVMPDNEPTTGFLFFQGAYNPKSIAYGWLIRKTMTVGKAITGGVISVAPGKSNPVLVIMVQYDNAFCNPTGLQDMPAECDGGPRSVGSDEDAKYPSEENHYNWV